MNGISAGLLLITLRFIQAFSLLSAERRGGNSSLIALEFCTGIFPTLGTSFKLSIWLQVPPKSHHHGLHSFLYSCGAASSMVWSRFFPGNYPLSATTSGDGFRLLTRLCELLTLKPPQIVFVRFC
jgi:hypothetical protein